MKMEQLGERERDGERERGRERICIEEYVCILCVYLYVFEFTIC